MKNFNLWQKVMDEFNREVAEIEDEAKIFINQSFKKLRSAEGAFEMLLRFKNIRSRDAINTEMMKKFTDILLQYMKEVDVINEIFLKNKQNPTLAKNHPPASGSIAWSRFLFKSIKRPMLKFLTIEELMNTDRGKEAKNHYLNVARQMKAFEDTKYNAWRIDVENILPDILKNNLLVKPNDKIEVTVMVPLLSGHDVGMLKNIQFFFFDFI
jgi:dynein heavy chain